MNAAFRRGSLVIVTAAVAGLGLVVSPSLSATPPDLPAITPDPYIVCPVAEAGGGFSSRLGIARATSGLVTVIGASKEPLEFEGADGFFSTEVGDLAELGLTPVLIESSGVGATYGRAGSVATVSGCTPAANGPVAIMGMSTAEGDRSTMVLVNPFAAEASLRLIGASEFGVDTPAALEEMTIPPSTSVEVVLDQAMTGRRSLSFLVLSDTGRVVAGMRRSGPTDVATSEAVTASTEWFFPLPDLGFDGEIHLRSLAAVSSAYRVDRYQPDGLVEAVAEGVLEPQGQAVIPVIDIAGPGSGVVIATVEPVAAAIVYAVDDVRAVAPGATTDSTRWLVPVSALLSEGQTTVWILNTADEVVNTTITRLGVPAVQTVALQPGMTTGVLVTGTTGGGIEISADGSIVVSYGVLSGDSIGLAAAVPLE